MSFESNLSPAALGAIADAVLHRSRAAGADRVTPQAWLAEAPQRLAALAESLRDGSWCPGKLLRIPKRKPDGRVRHLAILTVEDRIVSELLRRSIEPRVEATLSRAAYAYRRGRSAKDAVAAVLDGIRRGDCWVALADIRDYFDSIRVADVAAALREAGVEPAAVTLAETLLAAHALRTGRGLVQGSSLSPALSNLALASFDRQLLTEGHALTRYCDNLCVTGSTRQGAHAALSRMRTLLSERGLALKPNESRVAPVSDGFLWLGFQVTDTGQSVSEGALAALRDRIGAVCRGLGSESDRRLALLPVLRGWVQYFDVDLPPTVDLGPHGALTRALITELRSSGPGTEAPDPAVTGDPWDAETDEVAADDADEELERGEPGASVNELLDTSDRLASEGAYVRAEEAFEEAWRQMTAPPEPEPAAALPALDADRADAFLGLLCAGQARFEVAPVTPGSRREFAVVDRPPTHGDLREHLGGRCAIAVAPRLPDGRAAMAVIDVDGHGPSGAAVEVAVAALSAAAQALGLSALVEWTGGRGAHLWIPLDALAPARDVRALADRVVALAGEPGASVTLEILPALDDAVELRDQPITLPLGLHAQTGQRSALRWLDGPPVSPDLEGVFASQPNSVAVTQSAAREDEPSLRSSATPTTAPLLGASVRKVLDGCGVLSHLASKAAAIGHLTHSERLSLLYSLGHLGDGGRDAIHGLVGQCRNYDAAETERQIGRLGGLPISCRRLEEKHGVEAGNPCQCSFAGVEGRVAFATPLLHAGGFRREWRQALLDRRQGSSDESGRLGPAVIVREEPRPLPGAPGGLRPGGSGEPRPPGPHPLVPPVPPLSDLDPANHTALGIVLRSAPPHTWA